MRSQIADGDIPMKEKTKHATNSQLVVCEKIPNRECVRRCEKKVCENC